MPGLFSRQTGQFTASSTGTPVASPRLDPRGPGNRREYVPQDVPAALAIFLAPAGLYILALILFMAMHLAGFGCGHRHGTYRQNLDRSRLRDRDQNPVALGLESEAHFLGDVRSTVTVEGSFLKIAKVIQHLTIAYAPKSHLTAELEINHGN